jgi:hypothetical protein
VLDDGLSNRGTSGAGKKRKSSLLAVVGWPEEKPEDLQQLYEVRERTCNNGTVKYG